MSLVQARIAQEPNPKLRRHMERILSATLELKESISPELFQRYIRHDIIQQEKQIKRLDYELGGVKRSDYFRASIEVCRLILEEINSRY